MALLGHCILTILPNAPKAALNASNKLTSFISLEVTIGLQILSCHTFMSARIVLSIPIFIALTENLRLLE